MDHSYLFEVLNDNPDNIRMINDTLHDIKNVVFTNTYKAQQSVCGFYQTKLDFAEHEMIRHNRIVFTINYTYIEGKQRCEFKKSQFYKREVSSKDIFSNPDIFTKGILVFINGKLTNNYYVYFDDEKIQIRFARYRQFNGIPSDGLTWNAIDMLSADHATVQVVIMPICRRAYGSTTYQSIRNSNCTIPFNAEYITNASQLYVGVTPLLFMTPHIGSFTQSGVSFNTVKCVKTNSSIQIDSDTFPSSQYMVQNPRMYIDMYYPAHILSTLDIDSDGWFSLPIMRSPIPKENILIFRKLSTGLMRLDCEATIEMYYPNIYHIISNHDDEYMIYVFYNNNFDSIGLGHENELSIYTAFMDGVSEYSSDTIPDFIKTYTPTSMVYNIDDYDSEYLTDTLQYKIDKLRDVIDNNPKLYKYYLEKYTEMYPNVFTTVTEDDFNSRIRKDTSIELPNQPNHVFDSDRYVFSMRRENNAQIFRFIIDRKMYYPYIDDWVFTDPYDNRYMYFFIPTSIIHVGSNIEVQKLHNTAMAKTYVVDSSIPTHITLNPEYRVAGEDIYITHNNGAIDEYITEGFTLCEKLTPERVPNGTDISIDNDIYRPIDNTKFLRYSDLYIIWDNDSLNGETITVRSDKYTICVAEFDGITEVGIEYNINNDTRNFLIYRDGRLMSPYGIKVRYNEDSNGEHTVQALLYQEDTTVITAQHLPDKYNLVCDYHDDYVKRLRIYQKYMDTSKGIHDRHNNVYDRQIRSSAELEKRINDSGHFVDLTNKLTKPLDFRWYDIYMNGLKLTSDDVTFLGAYQMIITLNDDYPDIDMFVIIDMIGFIQKYVIPLPFINPDIQQITDEMIAEYPEVMDSNTNVVFDSDRLYSMRGSILLNPDVADGYTLHDVEEE